MVLLKQVLLNFISKYFVDRHKSNYYTRMNITSGGKCEDTQRDAIVSFEGTNGMHLFCCSFLVYWK